VNCFLQDGLSKNSELALPEHFETIEGPPEWSLLTFSSSAKVRDTALKLMIGLEGEGSGRYVDQETS
jgi:hypothetical protein